MVRSSGTASGRATARRAPPSETSHNTQTLGTGSAFGGELASGRLLDDAVASFTLLRLDDPTLEELDHNLAKPLMNEHLRVHQERQ